MGVRDDLSSGHKERLLNEGHPLDRKTEQFVSETLPVRQTRVSLVLALFDTCFREQDPDVYRHDWDWDVNKGMVMYREVTREELDVLVEVVESARNVTFTPEEVDVLVGAHSFFVGLPRGGACSGSRPGGSLPRTVPEDRALKDKSYTGVARTIRYDSNYSRGRANQDPGGTVRDL